MAKIYKLTKGGQTIYPATTTNAVVNPKTRNSLTAELSELGYKLIKLYAFSSSVSNLLEVGQIGYSTSSKILVKKETEDRVSTIPFVDGAIYEYNNELYTWDGTDLVKSNEQIELQVVSLNDNLDSISKSISYLNNDGAYNRSISNIIWEDGYYNSDGSIASGQHHALLDLIETDKYVLTNVRSLSPLFCVFFNQDGGVLSYFQNDNNAPLKKEIPNGAKKIGISNFSSVPLSSVYIIFNPTSLDNISEQLKDEYDVKLADKLDKVYDDFIPSNKLESTYISSSGYRIYTYNLSSEVDAIIIDKIITPDGFPRIEINFSDVNDTIVGEKIVINTGVYEGGNLYKPEGASSLKVKVYYSTSIPIVYSAIINKINIIEKVKEVNGNISNYQHSILNFISPTYISSSGYRTYTFKTDGINALYFNKCIFTSSGDGIGNATVSYYNTSDILINEEKVNTLEGYLSLPSNCAYMTLKCYYTSTIGICYSAIKEESSPQEAIVKNYNKIEEINSKMKNLEIIFHQYDDGAFYTFSDKSVGEDQSGKNYDLGRGGTLFAGGMPQIIIKEGGYIDGSDIEGSFYLTLIMKKRCSYCASTLILPDVNNNENTYGVLIIIDENSRDGMQTQFHRRILHVLLPNIVKSSVFSIQLGDYDKAEDGSPRWNYEYEDKTIVEIYSDIEPDASLANKKILWEMYVEDEILYIYLNHKLVKVYKNISSESENVANFAFSDLIPNADRAEIENCKVVDFCIGTQNFTYDMYSSLYNAKKLLGI